MHCVVIFAALWTSLNYPFNSDTISKTADSIRRRVIGPYGEALQSSGDTRSDFGYTGLFFHQRSGLNFTLHRAYDPALKRWLSRDPLTNSEVATGSNVYSYVKNRPLKFTDPTGLCDTVPNDPIAQVLTTVRSDPANAGLTEHQIAELAFSAIVDFRQTGFTGVDNQFAFLNNYQSTTLSNADHFLQSYANGTNNTTLENPLTAAILGAVIDPVYNVGKGLAQAVGYEFLPTGNTPQSPANFQFWALAGAWAATKVQFGGSVPGQVAPSTTPSLVLP
jgi:RHS repeat-associated protein